MHILLQLKNEEKKILRFVKVHTMGSWHMSEFCDIIALKWKNNKMDNLTGIYKVLRENYI